MDSDIATRLLEAFEIHGVQYVLVGSMAMAAHGLVRATRDIDVFVDPSAENVARLRSALQSVFHDPNIEDIRSEDLAGDYPAVCYAPPDGEFAIDILARLGEAFAFADIEAQGVDFDGTSIRVATPRMLYRMKKDTVRPQDHVDAAALKERFGLQED